MTEEKETPKSPKPREPIVMAEAIVTRDLEEKPIIDLKRRRL
jgi:hypothetical protein